MPDPTIAADAVVWLEALVRLALIDADWAELDIDALRAHVTYQVAELDVENIAERLAVLELTDDVLRDVVEGVWLEQHGFDDAA